MSNRVKYITMYITGLIFCIVPAVAATLEYFPLWKSKGPATLFSGVCFSMISLAIVVCVAFPPIVRAIKQKFEKKTPAAWAGFLICGALFLAVESVIHALGVIFVIAGLGNLCGAFLFRMAYKFKECEEKVDG